MRREGLDIKAVLFDLDGVLVDSYDAWFHQFQGVLRHFGHEPINEAEFHKHWGQSTDHDVATFMPERTTDEVKQYFVNHYHEYVKYLKLEPYAERILCFVNELNLHVGCVTNSHRPIVSETLAHFQIENYFGTVVTADDVQQPKPAPAMLREACRHLGTLLEQTLFLGDTPVDAQAAANAGCVFAGYRIDGAMRVEDHEQFAGLLAMLLDKKCNW
jgi:HAD superfamily hydrolase (TIGR01509 family)